MVVRCSVPGAGLPHNRGMTISARSTVLPLSLLAAPSLQDPDPLVLYHGRCADGFAAALAAWRFYGGRVQCLPLSHGQVSTLEDLPPLAGRSVYVLDFAFAPELLAAIDAQAGRLLLLDHHKSAAEQLAGFACRCGALHFDMDKSGARLAWEYFFPDAALPDLVRLVEDRDLWRWQHEQTAGFVAALDMEPLDFERWSALADFDAAQVQAFVARGQAMDEKFRHLAQDIARAARPVQFNGQAGLMVNAPGRFTAWSVSWCRSKAAATPCSGAWPRTARSRSACARSAAMTARRWRSAWAAAAMPRPAAFAWRRSACHSCCPGSSTPEFLLSRSKSAFAGVWPWHPAIIFMVS